MSSKNRNVQVKVVRIQWPDKKIPITHGTNVTVGMPKDSNTNIVYIRITVNQQIIISEELNQFQWLDECSTDGVVTINSSSMKIIIIYEPKDKDLLAFFSEMKKSMSQRPTRESPKPFMTQEQTELAINDLVKYIERGSSHEAELPAKYLARSQTNIQFNLVSHNDNEENKTIKKQQPKIESSSNILRLKLQIECHLNQDPIVETISVHSGTTLRALKEQIENETDINHKDQYWYAFDRYLISDDYEFGSTDPVVPPLPKNAPRKQVAPPTDPIRSGDTLILCIAQMPPFK